MIAEVAVNRPINKVFDYQIPQDLKEHILIGQRVRITFARKKTLGFVVGLKEKSEFKKLSSLEGIIDKEPLYTKELLEVAGKTAGYYLCSLGQILEAGVPFALKNKKSIIKDFKKAEIKKEKKESSLGKRSGRPAGPGGKDLLKEKLDINLKGHKQYLLLLENSYEKFSYYKDLISKVLSENKKVLILAPEAFSVEYLRRGLEESFSDCLAVFSSQQSQKQNKENLKQVYTDKARVIITTRSGVFLNISNLGLIIIEQEESDFYKRPDSPRYDARLVADLRAQKENLPLVRMSLACLLETYREAKKKQVSLLKEFVSGKKLKDFTLINLNEEEDITTRKKFLSYRLAESLKKALDNKRQAVIVYNRRGFASIIKCQKCKEVLSCPRCKTPLTYHYDKKKALCHRCNYIQDLPKYCPACKKDYVRLFGYGTQKIESNLAYLFPEARIERLDVDEASLISERFRIIEDFNKGRIDILIGTQILGAGLDFKNTDCLGILSLESLINQSDFRGLEKSFSFLFTLLKEYYTSAVNPHFLIQTYLLSLKPLEFLASHDYKSFLEHELEERKLLDLPPFSSLSRLYLRSKDKNKILEAANSLIKRLKSNKVLEVSLAEAGESELYKQRGAYALTLDIKSKESNLLRPALKEALDSYKTPSGVIIIPEIEAV
jgi:primosomal protein N' (replication factor Y)